MLEYLDFEVKIERRRGKRCTVSVINSPAGEASGTFVLPFTQAQLALIKATIEKAVLRSKMPTRRTEAPEVAQMKDFGADLFRVLFAEEVRACYAQSQAIVRQQGKGLRLKLRLDPSLAGLPWEFLYSRERRDFVILSRYNPIVRYTELKIPSEPLRVAPPLRLLVVIASPQEDRYYASLDTEREKQRILAALADLQETGVVTVDFLEGANSFRRLTHLLRREEYYILHFVGHGDYDKEHQEGVLVMEDEDRRGMWVGAQSLGRLLRDVTATRLAILNACVGAVASPADPFSSVAASLVGAGVPAVIAMQFEISDGAAITLAHEFYTALADNFPVDAALAEARKQISFDDPDSLEWATPVLYMRAPDGMLFDLAVAKEVVAAAREKAARRKEERQRQERLAILYDEAQESLEAENWSEAIARCNEILAIDPSYRNAASLLADVKRGLARQEKKEKLAGLYDEAMKSFERDDWQKAIDKFQQILDLEESYKDAAAKLAAAQEKLAKAERERREKLTALYEQAVAAMNAKQWQTALDLLEQVQAIDPSYGATKSLIAEAQAEAAKMAKAVAPPRAKPIAPPAKPFPWRAVAIGAAALLVVLVGITGIANVLDRGPMPTPTAVVDRQATQTAIAQATQAAAATQVAKATKTAQAETRTTQWRHRKPIVISEQSGRALTDFQVPLTIDTASLITAGKMRADCGDIRFTYFDVISETEIPYYLESGCDSVNTKTWIKVPSVPGSGTSTVYIYYDNPIAASKSNPDSVFLLYDDFSQADGTDPDSTKWVESCTLGGYPDCLAYGDAYIQNGQLKILASQDRRHGIYSSQDFPIEDSYRLEYRHLRDSGNYYAQVDFRDSSDVLEPRTWQDVYPDLPQYYWRSHDWWLQGVSNISCAGNWYYVTDQGCWKNSEGNKFAFYTLTTGWHHWSLIFDHQHDSISVYFDDNFVGSTDYSAFTTMPHKVLIWNTINTSGAIATFDDVVFRKYSQPEPTYSIGLEEMP